MSPSRGAVRRAAHERDRRRGRRRRRLLAAGALAVAASVAGWALVGVVTAPRAPSAPDVVLHQYHLHYEVTTDLRGTARTTTQDVWVDRPFNSRVENHDEAGHRLSLTIT